MWYDLHFNTYEEERWQTSKGGVIDLRIRSEYKQETAYLKAHVATTNSVSPLNPYNRQEAVTCYNG